MSAEVRAQHAALRSWRWQFNLAFDQYLAAIERRQREAILFWEAKMQELSPA
jgi:hypothetical protein